jgi:hypothetical protein
LIEFDNKVTEKVYECLLVFFDIYKFLPVRNISAFYMLTKGAKNCESKAGSLSKPLIQM